MYSMNTQKKIRLSSESSSSSSSSSSSVSSSLASSEKVSHQSSTPSSSTLSLKNRKIEVLHTHLFLIFPFLLSNEMVVLDLDVYMQVNKHFLSVLRRLYCCRCGKVVIPHNALSPVLTSSSSSTKMSLLSTLKNIQVDDDSNDHSNDEKLENPGNTLSRQHHPLTLSKVNSSLLVDQQPSIIINSISHLDQFRKHGEFYEHSASSREECVLPNRLDPFYTFYPFLDEKSHVAGGWSAFLHFNEHRRYVESWKVGGEIRNRDLDVWVIDSRYGDIASTSLYRSLHEMEWVTRSGFIGGKNILGGETKILDAPYLKVQQWLEKPSRLLMHFMDEHRHRGQQLHQHHDSIKAQVVVYDPVQKRNLSPPVVVDVLGYFMKWDNIHTLLDAFDLPWCRVAFYWQKNKRNWWVHPSHLNPYSKQSLYSQLSLFFDDPTNPKSLKPNISDRLAKNEPLELWNRISTREIKYRQRGYIQVDSSHTTTSSTSSSSTSECNVPRDVCACREDKSLDQSVAIENRDTPFLFENTTWSVEMEMTTTLFDHST